MWIEICNYFVIILKIIIVKLLRGYINSSKNIDWNRVTLKQDVDVLLYWRKSFTYFKTYFRWPLADFGYALWFYCFPNYKFFSLPIFWFWAYYLMKVIPDTCHVHSILYLRFYYFEIILISKCTLYAPDKMCTKIMFSTCLKLHTNYDFP